MSDSKRRRLAVGLAVVAGVILLPLAALAQQYQAPASSGGHGAGAMAPGGHGGPGGGGGHMRGPGPGRHMMGPGMAGPPMGPEHMAAMVGHRMAHFPPGHDRKPKHEGVVEGGFGSSANSGGSIVGDVMPPGGDSTGSARGGSIR
jgi:hypothetical protein